jgi:hypothetical protein
MTPLTLHRFLPLLGDYGKRALGRLGRYFGKAPLPTNVPIPALRALQRDDVRERLSIAALSRLGVIDKGRLGPRVVDRAPSRAAEGTHLGAFADPPNGSNT